MMFQFEAPWLLTLLLLVPILATLPLWARRGARPAGLRYADAERTRVSTRTRRLKLRPILTALRLLVVSLVIVGAARPQTGEAREIIEGEGVDIALALDMSGSMSSLDFEPQNRLEAAKQVISEFVSERRFDRIGLVVFASASFIQSPPTIDHGVLLTLLEEVQLAPDARIKDGTAIGLGIASAANMLKDSSSKSKVIILLTDGINNSGAIDPITAAKASDALGIKVYTIGGGSPAQGGCAPAQRFRRRIFHLETELDEETLRQIAATTDARYFRATDTEGLRQIYSEISDLEKSRFEVRILRRFEEMAAWLLLPALGLLLLEQTLRQTVFRKIP